MVYGPVVQRNLSVIESYTTTSLLKVFIIVTGKKCGIEIDECSSTPCLNGATCIDLINKYELVYVKIIFIFSFIDFILLIFILHLLKDHILLVIYRIQIFFLNYDPAECGSESYFEIKIRPDQNPNNKIQ